MLCHCLGVPKALASHPHLSFLDGYYKRGGRHNGMDYIAEWCNGNTNDSDSFILGSNPSSAATKNICSISDKCFLFFRSVSPRARNRIKLLKKQQSSGIIKFENELPPRFPVCVCAADLSETKWQTNLTETLPASNPRCWNE